nr:EOG090X0HQJ [Artemia franciscana]
MKKKMKIQCTLQSVPALFLQDSNRSYLPTRCLRCLHTGAMWEDLSLEEYVMGEEKFNEKEANHQTKPFIFSNFNYLFYGFYIFPDSVKPYTGDGDRKMKTIVSFDCRGMEPVDFSPRNGWQCEAVETGTKFDDVDLSEKEWVDYDEKAKETVGIYELAHQFVRQK